MPMPCFYCHCFSLTFFIPTIQSNASCYHIPHNASLSHSQRLVAIGLLALELSPCPDSVGELLEKSGELVDVQALTPAQTWVRYGGPDAAPVTTDGPLPETSDLVAGWYLVDVESRERALEIAAYISSEPGPGGTPLHEWIDVREVMSHTPSDD